MPCISVCIPIHNYNVFPLVDALYRQSGYTGVQIEIVCIDDGSEPDFVEINRSVESMAKYVVLEKNVGRARVRNLFLEHTLGDWMLFLDDDCMEIPNGFIENYVNHLGNGAKVIVGGSRYDDSPCDREHRARWLYGRIVESRRSATERNAKPYQSFMTNNFLIRRDTFELIHFDDRITGYGHEDTLFGFRLMQARIPILHIDNAVVNGDIDTNEHFLQKTQESIRNLVAIRQFADSPAFDESVRLLHSYANVERAKMIWAVKLWHRLTQKHFERQLLSGGNYSMTRFGLYKLGVLIDCINN